MIKKIYWFVLLLICYNSGQSQEQFTISNLTRTPQLSYANPALVPADLQFFIGIPILSGFQAYGNSQGFRLKDIGLMGLSDRQLDYPMAADRAGYRNVYRGGAQTDLLYGGIASKNGIFTLNFTERLIGETVLPMTFFQRLADEELGAFEERNIYDLSELFLQGMHFKELGVGYTTRKRKGVNWGIRLKFLLGHEGIFSENDRFMVLTQSGNQGMYLETSGDFALRTAGFQHFSAGEQLFRLFSARNAGVALDAGFHYPYNKRWEFFGSVHDLGGITWRRSLNLRSVSRTFPDLMSEIDDAFDDLVEEAPETTKSFRTALPVQFRAGMRYHLKNEHSVSALASTRLYQTGTDVGLSLAYHIPVAPCLDWTASYSVYNKQFANVGTGFSVQLGHVQWYVASDNVLSAFSPSGANNFHVQTGINLIWKKPEKKERPMANRDTMMVEDQQLVQQTGGEAAADEDPYFTLASHFVSGEEGREVNAIYVDIYRINANGEKQLIHTSRYPSDKFEVTLYRMNTLHEMAVGAYGFEPLVFQFFPDSKGLKREFKLTAENKAVTDR